MDGHRLKIMGAYSVYSTNWRDSRDNQTYHLRTLVKIEEEISATGENIETKREKRFTTEDFLQFLEPVEEK